MLTQDWNSWGTECRSAKVWDCVCHELEQAVNAKGVILIDWLLSNERQAICVVSDSNGGMGLSAAGGDCDF